MSALEIHVLPVLCGLAMSLDSAHLQCTKLLFSPSELRPAEGNVESLHLFCSRKEKAIPKVSRLISIVLTAIASDDDAVPPHGFIDWALVQRYK